MSRYYDPIRTEDYPTGATVADRLTTWPQGGGSSSSYDDLAEVKSSLEVILNELNAIRADIQAARIRGMPHSSYYDSN